MKKTGRFDDRQVALRGITMSACFPDTPSG
jgi:hypothetical protein